MLGDVVESRDIADRSEFRTRLKQAIQQINDEHAESLYADLSMLKGIDELGGVLQSVAPIYEIRRTLTEALFPERIRLVFVRGTVEVTDGTADVSTMDGAALVRADEQLREIEAEEREFAVDIGDPMLDTLIEDETGLIDLVKSGWSERRMEVVRTYRETGSNQATGDALGITSSAVSNALRRSHARQLFPVERRLTDVLTAYDELLSEASDED